MQHQLYSIFTFVCMVIVIKLIIILTLSSLEIANIRWSFAKDHIILIRCDHYTISKVEVTDQNLGGFGCWIITQKSTIGPTLQDVINELTQTIFM